MASESEWPEIFEGFYAAAFRPELWISTLTRAAETMGVAGVSVIGPPNANIPTVNPARLDLMSADYFAEDWYRHNDRLLNCIRFWSAGSGFGRSRLVSNETLIDDDPLMTRLPIQEEFFRRHDLRWFIGGRITLSQTEEVYLSIDRYERQQRFSCEELQLSDLICQHLTLAMKIVHSIDRAAAAGALQSFEALGKPAFLLGPDMRLATTTPLAEPYLRTLLNVKDGVLHARDPAANGELRKQVATVSGREFISGRVLPRPIVLKRGERRPVVVSVAPYQSATATPGVLRPARALLLLHDPEAETPLASGDMIRDILGLTPAEARLAFALARGDTVRAFAERSGVAFSTARNQLTSVFMKTGVGRQADLCSLIRQIRPD